MNRPQPTPSNLHPGPDNDPHLDVILAALTSAQPPADLHQRLLARLADATQRTPPATAPFRLRPVPAAAALAVAAGLLLLWPTLHSRPTPPTRLAALQLPHEASTLPSRAAATPSTEANHPHVVSGARSAQPGAPRQKTVVLSEARSAQSKDPEALHLTQTARSIPPSTPHPNPDEILALAELHAPSLPEPPQPLTRQERLLLAASHMPGAPGLAAPDPTLTAVLTPLNLPFASNSSSEPIEQPTPAPARAHQVLATLTQALFAGIGPTQEPKPNPPQSNPSEDTTP